MAEVNKKTIRLLIMDRDMYNTIVGELIKLANYSNRIGYSVEVTDIISDLKEIWEAGSIIELPLSVALARVRYESSYIASRSKEKDEDVE